ncbi:hypothetical protein [Bradyrhizobium sp. 164]|uniref:hypothetical protein n=1 Tax=Bradyrhizobium sp. 164 TaxID=2782637 RepID=UPI001FFA65D2|nr:hypothetical protein [Bradyrhizobium sp. 164]MCK1594673.1 hypothetical protein [Bradyrhizobium sp. 164]
MSSDQIRTSSGEYLGGMLVFVGRAVRPRIFAIVSVTLAVMLVVFLVDRMLPAGYVASANVRLGRVDGAEVVPVQAAALQVNSLPFKRRLVTAMNLRAENNDRDRQQILDSLSVRPQASDVFSLTVRAGTEERAREALQAAVRQLSEGQDKLRNDLLSELNAQIALVDANIANLTKIRETLASPNSLDPEVSKDAAALMLRRVWVLDLISKNEERLAAALGERRALATRIGPTKTYPTTLSEDVTIIQVSPQPTRHAMFAGAIALLAMLLYAIIRGPSAVRART